MEVLLIASIWSIIALNVWYMVNVRPCVVFNVSSMIGISCSSSCEAFAVRLMSPESSWNFSASWSKPSIESNNDRNEIQTGMS